VRYKGAASNEVGAAFLVLVVWGKRTKFVDKFVMMEEIERFEGRPKDVEGRSEAEVAVYDFLDGVGVDYVTLWHPAAYTMEECERVRECLGAPVFKNLFLTNKQQTDYYLLMIPADKPFKTKYLSSQLGCARLSFGSQEAMMEFLHIAPGAVSPMGLIHDKGRRVRLIVDQDLADTERYACHPCVNTASIALSLSDLLEKVVPAMGHDYTWVNLPTEG
jgi:Ala-tRNA(Pro) deacylase